MAANVGRWLKYAQAKLNRAVDAGNDELDQLEAEREAELADKPWLASDSEAPTLEEAKARIEWEAEEQRRRAEAIPDGDAPPASEASAAPGTAAAPKPALDPEVAAARIELDRQARESRLRLEEIRKELGVDAPVPPDPPPAGG